MGAQVEVHQPDGQTLTATLNKLTDQSTYTVGEYLIESEREGGMERGRDTGIGWVN